MFTEHQLLKGLWEAWGCSSLVKYLPSTGEALDSILTAIINKSINKGTFYSGTQLLSLLFIEQEASTYY